MPKPSTLNPTRLRAALRHLQGADEKLAALVARVGSPQMRHEPDAWKALASSIMAQQISVHAARAIRARVAALGDESGFPTPAQMLKLPDETLRGAGLSQNKMLALRDLARHFEEEKIAAEKFAALDDEAIIAALIPVRGIGRWTAEMFLIFSLQRADVLAVDDWGLRSAAQRLYELPAPPKAAEFRALAEPWRPFRSVASWYLWRSLENLPA